MRAVLQASCPGGMPWWHALLAACWHALLTPWWHRASSHVHNTCALHALLYLSLAPALAPLHALPAWLAHRLFTLGEVLPAIAQSG
eukprot:361615-Chlamydomonas_euryale.AAC.6